MPSLIHDPEKIEISNNDSIQEILGSPPNWTMRWGILVIFVFISIFLILSWVIKYPDIIVADTVITSKNPPINIVALKNGFIQDLLIENNQEVQKGQWLAVIENPASWSDVQRLMSFLDELKNQELIEVHNLPEDLVLGDVQNLYANFKMKVDEYYYLLENPTYNDQVTSLNAKIDKTKGLNESIQTQISILSKEVDIIKRKYIRNVQLQKEGVISEVELETSETEYLRYQRQLQELNSNIFNNEIAIQNNRLEIYSLNQSRSNDLKFRKIAIQEDIQLIEREIKAWIENYVLVAPISGYVSLLQVWANKQPIQVNDKLFAIVRKEEKGKTIGKSVLPIYRSGKVEIGMKANVRLDDFPYQEYGVLKAKIASISLVPKENHYIVELTIDSKQSTSFGKSISFKEEMRGKAHIITSERRVLERIFTRLLSLSEM